MSADYPYKGRFSRSSTTPVVQDPETGLITPGGTAMVTVAEGWFDVQDAGVAQPRTAQGAIALDADSTWFAKDEAMVLNIEPNDVATVWYPPDYTRSAEGNAVRTREFDGAIDVKYR